MNSASDGPAKTGQASNLMKRVLSALVLIPVALGVIYLGGFAFVVAIIILALLMMYEWNSICMRDAVRGIFACQAILIAAVSILIGTYDIYMAFMVMILGIVALAVITLLLARRYILWVICGPVYALFFAASLIWVRQQPEIGLGAICWLMATVWCTDTGAYFAGKTIGGPKLAPRISPKKTWAGLIGGMACAAVASYCVSAFFDYHPLWLLALAGACMAVWGQIGDITESALKRRFNVKDSGALIPGHGGILDRVDAIVFVAPVVAAYLALRPIGDF